MQLVEGSEKKYSSSAEKAKVESNFAKNPAVVANQLVRPARAATRKFEDLQVMCIFKRGETPTPPLKPAVIVGNF